jgi:hypothetical protein
MKSIYCAVGMLVLTTSLINAGEPKLALVFEDDFEKGLGRWQPTDTAAWKIEKSDKGNFYSQFVQSKYKTKHRSPFNISLVKDVNVTDFVLEAKARSTGKDVPHRDMCLFFGYQDPAHFYYVHMAKAMDDHANQIFIVNGADRVKISTKTSKGTPWDDKWHNIKIVRKVESGAIEIHWDDMKAPIMTATDKTFTWGQVGIGSFDDTGNWDDVRVYGKRHEKK